MFDSLYMSGTCCFHFYFFFHKDFAVPLFHPLFDPTTPYIAITLHIAHPSPPPAAPVATPLASPHHVVPSLSFNDDSDPSEVVGSSPSSSSSSGVDYTPVELGMANGFLSPEPM